MIFFTFGTGLGAGLILNGRLYSGSSGMAGEAGHVRLARSGPMGYGKAGSFEGFCSGGGIAKLAKARAAAALRRGEPWSIAEDEEAIEALDARVIAEAARAGDANARSIFKTVGKRLGQGLSIMLDILNPDVIVIGSIYQRCEDLLRDEAMRVIRREVLPETVAAFRLLPAELGDSIGDIAALAVAAEL